MNYDDGILNVSTTKNINFNYSFLDNKIGRIEILESERYTSCNITINMQKNETRNEQCRTEHKN